jgi:3-hydroxybutyrate dehydrogenase
MSLAKSELSDRWALVTGGLGGIGAGIACELATGGASILMHDIGDLGRQSSIEQLLLSRGAKQVEFSYFDLSAQEDSASNWQILSEKYPVDVLVNCAGRQATSPLAEFPRKVWDEILATSLSAAFDTMRVFMPRMRATEYGRIFNIASVHGLVASANKAAYVAAKHGLVGLTRVAALEYAAVGDALSGGVTVNAICPGWTHTPMIEPQIQEFIDLSGGDRALGMQALLAAKQPSLRFTSPAEIGSMVRFMCGRQFHNWTGTVIPIDGGWTAQ